MANENDNSARLSLTEIIEAQHKARAFHDDPVTDRLMAELLRSLEENCVLRDRIDTCQRLLAQGLDPTEEAIDAYDAAESVLAERLESHRSYYDEVFARLGKVG